MEGRQGLDAQDRDQEAAQQEHQPDENHQEAGAYRLFLQFLQTACAPGR